MEAVWLISFKTVYKPINWTYTICSECCSSANFQNSTVRTYYPSAHQSSLALRPRTYVLSDWQLGLLLINLSTEPLGPTYSRVSPVLPTTSRRQLRSSTSHCLDVPPVRLCRVSNRAFPVSGATVWNDLPLHVASAPSLAVFKTFLFSRSYQDTITWLTLTLLPLITTVWTPVVLAIINII